MFSGPTNPYDELVNKATDENLASEDWDVNLQICDKVGEEGTPGARNAVASLIKRLSHRNPNVQIYALELANTLAQNCGKPLQEELASRTWTSALERILNDRATVKPVQTKVLKYVKEWTQQFERTGDPNLGLMTELYDKLRGKYNFEEVDEPPVNAVDARRQAEEDELARVLELSKQDKGGRGAHPTAGSSSAGATSLSAGAMGVGAVAGAAAAAATSSRPSGPSHAPHAQYNGPSAHDYELMSPPPQAAPAYGNAAPAAAAPSYQAQPQPQAPPPADNAPDINRATRVRALYTFSSESVGELSFERGDVIKVLDRGFQEWWRGASNGKIGIFPVIYVEPLPEPSAAELQEEAQEEARVFASLGLVDQLLQTLKAIDPNRGDRIEDNPEVQEMYQASVALQGQINALIKKYSDQKAELEHMNANFLRAMQQYEELKGGAHPPQQQQPYPPQPYQSPGPQVPGGPAPSGAPPAGQPQPYYPQQSYPAESPAVYPSESPQQFPQPQPGQAGQQQGMYYQSGHSTTSVNAPGYGAPTSPSRQGSGAVSQQDHQAAWDAYYRQTGQQPPAGPPGQPTAYPQQAPPQQGQPPQGQPYGGYPQPHDVSNQMGRMSIS